MTAPVGYGSWVRLVISGTYSSWPVWVCLELHWLQLQRSFYHDTFTRWRHLPAVVYAATSGWCSPAEYQLRPDDIHSTARWRFAWRWH